MASTTDDRQDSLPILVRLASIDITGLTLTQLPSLVLPLIVDLLTPDIACIYSPLLGGLRFEATAVHPASFWDQTNVNANFRIRDANTGALRRALQSGDIHIVDDPSDALQKGDYIPFTKDVALEILVPIAATDPLTGGPATAAVLVLSWWNPPTRTPDQTALLSLLRSITARHFELINAGLARDRQSRFLDSFASIPQSTADDLYGSFLTALSSLFPIRLATFWRYSSRPESLILRSIQPDDLDGIPLTPDLIPTRSLLLRDSPVHGVLETKQPRIFQLKDVSSSIPNEPFLQRFRLDWWVSFPILKETAEPLGVINVWPDAPPESFRDQHMRALMNYASRMRDVVGLAKLSQRASLVDAFRPLVDNLLTFEDRQDAWDGLALLVAQYVQAEACSIFLAAPDNLLHLKGSTGLDGSPEYGAVTYAPNEGLTGRAFLSPGALLYIKGLDATMSAAHISKFRERLSTPGPSRSILLAPIKGPHNENLGVLRCNNKSGARLSGEQQFTPDDVAAIEIIATVVSHLHITSSRMAATEAEREQRLRSLYHEIISPVDHLSAHLEWIRRRLTRDITDIPAHRLRVKLTDMDQIGQTIVNVTRLLDKMSTERRLELTVVSLTEIVSTTISFLTNEAQRLRVRVSPLLERVDDFLCDKDAMMRICYNLFRNALKYVDPAEPSRYMTVQLSFDDEAGVVTITVEDNGIGIPPGEEELIFERFRRGSNAAEHAPLGEGLGLWYCRQLVTRMGGRIWLSGRHKPTRFTISLPD